MKHLMLLQNIIDLFNCKIPVMDGWMDGWSPSKNVFLLLLRVLTTLPHIVATSSHLCLQPRLGHLHNCTSLMKGNITNT